MPYHEQASARLAASADSVFAFVDDPLRLSGHMTKRSLLMGGSRMNVETDALKGRAPGSCTRLSGRLLGFEIEVRTEVIERDPPRRKTWRSMGEPRLLVIGPYAMSVTIEPVSGGCDATVAIDYELPRRRLMVAMALARVYARWCVRRMVLDITAAFPAIHTAMARQ